MYHSHFDEVTQISAGLYGPIVVLDSGKKFDADRDKVLMFGVAGHATNVIVGPFPHYLLNGSEHPDPMNLRAGSTYRFRIINMGATHRWPSA